MSQAEGDKKKKAGGELMDNMTIFDMLYPKFKIDKPIRLIDYLLGRKSGHGIEI